MLAFVCVAWLISYLTSRIRAQAAQAENRECIAQALYEFSRRIAAISSVPVLVETIVQQISDLLMLPVALCLPKDGTLQLVSTAPGKVKWNAKTWAAAKWCWEKQQACGHGSEILSAVAWYFMPLSVGDQVVGLIAVRAENNPTFWQPDKQYLYRSLVNQSAVAILRIQVESLKHSNALLAESDRLRSALLTSVSHDLRTPLASVMGAMSGLRQQFDHYTPTARAELMDNAYEEAKRLDRYISNLVNMSRLQADALQVKTQVTDSAEVLALAMKPFQALLKQRQSVLEIPEYLPQVDIDPVLTEQVFVNLIENALKYSPDDTPIRIDAQDHKRFVAWLFQDQGHGFSTAEAEHAFDLFYRAKHVDQNVPGTGMGLAICQGLTEAQGGHIHLQSEGRNKGSCITVTLPKT